PPQGSRFACPRQCEMGAEPMLLFRYAHRQQGLINTRRWLGQLRPCLNPDPEQACRFRRGKEDRKSTRLNSSHVAISYAVFCMTVTPYAPLPAPSPPPRPSGWPPPGPPFACPGQFEVGAEPMLLFRYAHRQQGLINTRR